MIKISMTLNWRTHGNTGKLLIIKMSSTDLRRRVRVGQKNYLSSFLRLCMGQREVLTVHAFSVLSCIIQRCKYQGQFWGKTHD